MSAAESSSVTVIERVQNFISEHKQAILIGAAAVAVAGSVVYYTSTSSELPRPPNKDAGKKKKTRGDKSKKLVDKADLDRPILEELTASGSLSSEEVKNVEPTRANMTAESSDDRAQLASDLKLKGNKAYQERKFAEAVDYYTRAIEVSPKPDPVFYSNRAACYMYYSTPDFEKAVNDCSEALKINPRHERSLQRRGTALEKLGKLEESLRDFTAVTLLRRFADPSSSQAVERVIKKLTEPKAKAILESREPRLPPHAFLRAYFNAFRSRPVPALPGTPTLGDGTLKLALEALEARDYPHSLTLINEALEQGISFNEGKAQALNIRGSFKFLCGDTQGAKEDFLASITAMPSYTLSWVKIASVYMEHNSPDDAFQAFEQAIAQNPKDPDIYYHRGQVLFIMQRFDEASDDYSKSLELDADFVFSHIQLAVAQYKGGRIQKAMATFRKALKAFPQRSEPFNYYGELLLDTKRYEDAIEKFERAIEIEKAGGRPLNVLPMVNKALAICQWKADLETAEKVVLEALEYDPESEAAIATLAQLSLQQGKVERASELFRKQVDLARTEADVMNALQFAYAAEAQFKFAQNFPEDASQYLYADGDGLMGSGPA